MLEETMTRGSWRAWHDPENPPAIGVSACLLGQLVRFDGGHTRSRFATDELAPWVRWVSVCPEVEIGMDIPRPAIRLVDEGDGMRLVAPSTREDFTARMRSYAERKVTALAGMQLDGYILKKDSPSCGMERITVHRGGNKLRRDASGMFAQELMERLPELPVEEEGRLNDRPLREHFIERTFARNRWKSLATHAPSRRRLIEFHTAHKLQIRVHDEELYMRMGRLVGAGASMDLAALYEHYGELFHAAFQVKASTGRHVNVLQHAMGYFKRVLDGREKQQLLTAIDDYAQGLVPLVVPLTLVRFNIERHGVEYLAGQLYFDPYPKELMLRNHS